MGYIRGAEVLLKGFLWLLQWLVELEGSVVQQGSVVLAVVSHHWADFGKSTQALSKGNFYPMLR